jgi:hypothetical protein
MSGNVSTEGALLDLAWMRRIGIGGVHVFSGGNLLEPVIVDTPLPFMSLGWKKVFARSARAARSHGMNLYVASSSGWSLTGGTWVAPADAMKKYVWSERVVEGGRSVESALPRPPSTSGPFLGVEASYPHARPRQLHHDLYEDAVVIAFPTPDLDRAAVQPELRSANGTVDLSLLSDDCARTVALEADVAGKAQVEAIYQQPVTVCAVTVALDTRADVELEVWGGGGFRTIASWSAEHPDACPQQTYAFAPVEGTRFRLTFAPPRHSRALPDLPPRLPASLKHFQSEAEARFVVRKVQFSLISRANRFEAKAGFQAEIDFAAHVTPRAAPGSAVEARSVLDLTNRLGSDGRLDWSPPAGRWTIVRLGWSLTGRANQPAEDESTGLEVDKLDAAAVRRYLTHYLDLYANAGDAQQYVEGLVTDSWEAGVQNWSRDLLSQFQSRRGYDPFSYLPALVGYVVDDADTTDRFLWDFRETLKEMLVEYHYGTIADELHRRNMVYFSEAQGDTPRAIADGMAIKARADVPTGEFWFRPFGAGPGQPPLKADLHEAASVAHLYGRREVAAEALTVAAGRDMWGFSPRMLKPVADEIFARGVNRILIHESHHQPLVHAKPGLSLGFFGQFFNRNETWAEEAGPWISYISRTSFLLQQGRYVADIAYFYGEERNLTELHQEDFELAVPSGYQFDFVNAEALRTLLSVADGRLVTKNGMRYRVLYLAPHVNRLTPGTLLRIRDLVRAGAVLIGKRPESGLGIRGRGVHFDQLVREVWGEAPTSAKVRSLGRGRVYETTDLAAVLRTEAILPPISASPAIDDILIHYRRTDDCDIYFLSNRRDVRRRVELTLGTSHTAVELWRAYDGSVATVSATRTLDGLAVVVPFEAHEALFLIAHDRKSSDAATWSPSDVLPLHDLDGPWSVRFGQEGEPGTLVQFARLSSWSDSTDARIRFFSGHAIYSKDFEVPQAWLRQEGSIFLDLGVVHEMAVVSLNGKQLATSWHPPHRIDLSRALRVGKNYLEIRVINLWPNRLIGDSQPATVRTTFAPQSTYGATSPLMPSGLLGPVRLLHNRPRAA